MQYISDKYITILPHFYKYPLSNFDIYIKELFTDFKTYYKVNIANQSKFLLVNDKNMIYYIIYD